MPVARRCWSAISTSTVRTEPNPSTATGYFPTGDLARGVDGNYLVVTGRVKDLIIRNGENISPKEIEDT